LKSGVKDKALCPGRLGKVEVAARRGLPMLLFFHFDDEAKTTLLARYADTAQAHGHDPTRIDHVWSVVGYVADSQEAARQVVCTTLPPWLTASAQAYTYLRPEDSHRADVDAFVQTILQHHPIGTPEYCIERLAKTMERTGLRHCMIMLEAAGDCQRSRANIERFATEVLARLRH
jgi:alkanesulfonate monooxygenase SsuD/methylene tetrahydromethanopterin reductase-like flavin-dependent oxidoreductase (luciferase family)